MESLRKREDFRRLRVSGRSFRGRNFDVRVLRTRSAQELLIGFAIPKRVGTAVTRNKVRRRLRAATRVLSAEGKWNPGLYLVFAKEGSALATYNDIVGELAGLVEASSSEKSRGRGKSSDG